MMSLMTLLELDDSVPTADLGIRFFNSCTQTRPGDLLQINTQVKVTKEILVVVTRHLVNRLEFFSDRKDGLDVVVAQFLH